MGLTPTLILSLLGQPAPAAAPPAREIARAVRLAVADAHAGKTAELLPEPIYLFDDPARRFARGAVWAWGTPGRPAALMTAAIQHRSNGDSWLCELTSLAEASVSARVPGGPFWVPRGVPAPAALPKAPAPAGSESKRLLQLKELARRFAAYEFYHPNPAAEQERFQLRMLPQPVHRYADPAAGLIDGALFLFVYGRNPEVVLVLEARRGGAGGPGWSYAFGRIAGARLHVNLDGAEVWQAPRQQQSAVFEPYWVFVRPIEREE